MKHWTDDVIKFCRREYAKRRQTERCHCSLTAEAVLALAEETFHSPTYGVEGFASPRSMYRGIQFLNTGDTYATTVIFRAMGRDDGRWSIGSWGDIAERSPEYQER